MAYVHGSSFDNGVSDIFYYFVLFWYLFTKIETSTVRKFPIGVLAVKVKCRLNFVEANHFFVSPEKLGFVSYAISEKCRRLEVLT